jgi:hypothetical protein
MEYLPYLGLIALGLGLYLYKRFTRIPEFRLSKIIKIEPPDETLLKGP